MKQILASQLDELVTTAQASPRRRANLNLHQTLGDPVQRLAIAMEPDTLILPHRHRHTWELLLPLRGRFVVLTFDDAGVLAGRTVLGAATELIEMPAGQWHGVLSLDSGGVIFEVKQGPYAPIEAADVAPWLAGDPSPQSLLDWYAAAKPGDCLADFR
jgi:cupin fold WbuC family metalloprotein